MINTNVSGNNVFDTNLFYHRKLWNDIDCLADQNFRPNYFNESNQRIRILHHNVRSLLKRFSFLIVSKIIRPRRKLIHFRNSKSIDNIAFFNHAKSLLFYNFVLIHLGALMRELIYLIHSSQIY